MPTSPDRDAVRLHILRAIQIVGSEGRLGKATGYTQNAIWQAKRRGSVTAEMAIAIEVATSGVVDRHHLRPDIFGPHSAQAA
jgi:DNA-binding transcriptional regulator YdaS (Cro superfamily)